MINVLYCTNMCSEKVFEQLSKKLKNLGGQQILKYHRILSSGLAKQPEIEVVAFSKIPTTKLGEKYKIPTTEEMNGVHVVYSKTIQIPLIKHLYKIFTTFIAVMKLSKKDTIVCLDTMFPIMGLGVIIACKVKRLKLIGIVTDMPSMTLYTSLFSKIGMHIISKCDAYLLLTEQMNDLINKDRKKPFVVLEGHVDSTMAEKENLLINKSHPRVFMYAGLIRDINGLGMLLNAFKKANLDNTELHIYGDGPDIPMVQAASAENKNIIYGGCLLVEEILNKEISASLLISPRPSNQEFVKYSFPSKLMEYLASGTPVLTTRLCGIPNEYYPYLYTIDNEDEDGLCEDLKKISCLSDEELNKKGLLAKDFVLKNKNEIIQGEKFANLIKLVFNDR